MSQSIKVAGQSGFFLLGNIFTLFVGFALQIYLAKKLGADGLGVFGLLESGVGVMLSLLSLGIGATAVRYIPEYLKSNDYGKIHHLVQAGGKILIVLGLVGYLLVLISLPLINDQWPELKKYQSESLVIAALIPLGLLIFFTSQVLRGFLDIRYIVIGSSFIQLSVKALLSLLFIFLGWSVLGYIWAIVIASVFTLIWMIIGVRKHLGNLPKPKCSTKIQPEWKSYAKVMYGNSLLHFWSAPLDRFLLGFFVGPSAVGILMIVKTLHALPAVFLQMFLSIVAPMMAAAHAEGDRKEVQHIYHLCTDWLVRISLPLVIFLMFFAHPILLLFGEEFAEQGTSLLQLLLFSQMVNLLCGPIGNVLLMCGLERHNLNISIVVVISSAIIMLIAIPLWGLIGVGWAVFVSIVYLNLASLYVAKKHLSIHWWHSKYYSWLYPAVITIIVAFLMEENVSSPIALVAVLLSLYLVFHGALWIIYGLNDEDKEIYMALKRRIQG